jgi:TatA/E family protein of Tat protein translocase
MILLVIVIVLFGAGRIGKIGGELGSGICNFREAMQYKDENKKRISQKRHFPEPNVGF